MDNMDKATDVNQFEGHVHGSFTIIMISAFKTENFEPNY
jgi:hypothetical protein